MDQARLLENLDMPHRHHTSGNEISGNRDVSEDPMQGRTLFTILGVPWKLTPTSIRFAPSRLATGVILAFILLRAESLEGRLFYGLVFGLVLLASQFLHIIGHILGGKIAGHPMSASLIIAYQFTTYYEDEQPLTRRVHLIRTIGGPLANFILAAAAFLAWQRFAGYILLYTAIINSFLALLLFLPFKGIDGEIFWREIRRKSV